MEIQEYLQNNVSWSEPQIVDTKYGVKKVRKAGIPSSFWDLWKSQKEEIKEAGISVSKYQGEWQISFWEDYKEEEVKKEIKQDIELKYSDLLLPYQIDHVKKLIYAIENYCGALDGSDTGTGKTFTSLSVAKELNLFPIVITRKAVIPSFKKAMQNHFGIDGFVSNYEQFKNGNTEYLKKNDNKDYEWNVPDNAILIWDEVHSCKNYKSINAEMLRQAVRQDIKCICMSATVADNPLHMESTGRAIRIFKTKSEFFKFCFTHGCYKGKWGIDFNNSAENLNKIHNSIYREKGSRIAIKDLGDAFPENKIIVDSYDMNSNAKKIQKIYKEMDSQLSNLKEKEENDDGNHLTIQLRARQQIELLKVPTFVEMAKDLIEEGNSVVIFMNFDESIKALSEKLKTNCIIWGKNKGEERENNRIAFQEGKERIIICNIKAGGVGISLHDELGNYSRVSLISPTWSAVDLKQSLGRIHRAGGQSKVVQKLIFCANTIEEDIADKVQIKINNIDTINDGDLQ